MGINSNPPRHKKPTAPPPPPPLAKGVGQQKRLGSKNVLKNDDYSWLAFLAGLILGK